MKTRHGFVSNSSSSSFVLKGNKTVLEYARQMVPYREWAEVDDRIDRRLQDLQEDPEWNDDAPIWFKSCNYDTMIAKLGDHVYIATCNNHPFYDAFDNCDSANVNFDVMKKELSIIMNEEDADNYASDFYDLYMENYKFFYTYIDENYIEESKIDIKDQPKFISHLKKKEYETIIDSDDRWEYSFDDKMTFEMFKKILRYLKSGNVQIHCDDIAFSKFPIELQQLFTKY